jgi:hypothetical protein
MTYTNYMPFYGVLFIICNAMRVGVKLTILLHRLVTALFDRTTKNSSRFLNDWPELMPSRTSAEEIHIHIR